MPDREYAKHVEHISESIHMILHGQGPNVQGAVLAELVATWLAGRVGPDRGVARKAIMKIWLKMMFELVPVCEIEIARRQQRHDRIH